MSGEDCGLPASPNAFCLSHPLSAEWRDASIFRANSILFTLHIGEWRCRIAHAGASAWHASMQGMAAASPSEWRCGAASSWWFRLLSLSHRLADAAPRSRTARERCCGPMPRVQHGSGESLESSSWLARLCPSPAGSLCVSPPVFAGLENALLLCGPQWMSQVNTSLSDSDPEIFDIVEREKNRQVRARLRLTHLQRCSLTGGCDGGRRDSP